jgi:hypothetical protein
LGEDHALSRELLVFGLDVGDRERGVRDAVGDERVFNGFAAGWASGSSTSSTPSGSSGDTTVSQECSPTGTLVFSRNPSTSV